MNNITANINDFEGFDFTQVKDLNAFTTLSSFESDDKTIKGQSRRQPEDCTFTIDILNMIEKGDDINPYSSQVLEDMLDDHNFNRGFDEDLSIHFEYQDGDTDVTVIIQGETSTEEIKRFYTTFKERFSHNFAEALCQDNEDLNIDEIKDLIPDPEIGQLSDMQVGITNFPFETKVNTVVICLDTSNVELAIDDFYDGNSHLFQTPYQGSDALERTVEILNNTTHKNWSVKASYDTDDLDVIFESNNPIILDAITTQEVLLICDDALRSAVAELSNCNSLIEQVEQNRILTDFITKTFTDPDERLSVLSAIKNEDKLELKGKVKELDTKIGTKVLSSPRSTRPLDVANVSLSDALQSKLNKVKAASIQKSVQNLKSRQGQDDLTL